MVKINLRDYYPDFYTTDCIIEVPDDIATLISSYERAEAAYYLRRYRIKRITPWIAEMALRRTSCSFPYPPAKSMSAR